MCDMNRKNSNETQYEFMTCYCCGRRFYFGGYTYESYAYKACDGYRHCIFCSYKCHQNFLKYKAERKKNHKRKRG